MSSTKSPQKLIGAILAIVVLSGCGSPTSSPTLPPTLPPPPQTPPTTFLPPPPPNTQPTQTIQTSLFKLIQTVQVTPDEHFPNSIPADIVYIPATDRIVAIMWAKVDQPMTLPTSEVCDNTVIGYMEYTTDMQPTGEYGYLSCGFADVHARGIVNDVYIAKVGPGGPGYTLEKYDGITWKKLASLDISLDGNVYDPGVDISYINGYIVVTGFYRVGGRIVGATHNRLFTTDLAPVKTILLSPPEVPEHHAEFSLLHLSNGDILMFASAGPPKGNLEVLRFDKDWHFLEQKWLRDHAYYPTGVATDGQYVYVAYLDWSWVDTQAGQNVGLAAFDAQWNLIQDVVLTDVQSMSDLAYGEQDSIVLHGNRLYLSYAIHTLDPDTGVPDFSKDRAYIAVFELNQKP